MRAVTLDAFDAAPAVRYDLPDPTAAAGGMVVRVRASSVNPVDNAIAAGRCGKWSTTTFRSSSDVTTRAPSKQSAGP
jgi:NADPH:quinone reductase-like Zn-dependent oxidoreductase